MKLHFYKYQGTGNDFVLLDNRTEQYAQLSTEQIKFLCDRHFGIGADGLMLLNRSAEHDFGMTYFNSDGQESSMCGNGGRCISSFAQRLGLVESKASFTAIDGLHEAVLGEDGFVRLHMNDVYRIDAHETFFELNTGSPHYVAYTEDLAQLDMKREGFLIRYSPRFKEQGINVNLVQRVNDHQISVRTYERGVEDETLSCGTGVTACALVHIREKRGDCEVQIQTPGGQLVVQCHNIDGQSFNNIWLCGKASFVFEGTIDLA